jgi:hypothetical protein
VKIIHLIFVFCALLMLGGCANRKSVTLVDDSGSPISGVRIVAQAMSIEGVPAFTSADGTAKVDTGVLGARWLAITKDGYQREQVNLPASWPLRVTLKKETPRP